MRNNKLKLNDEKTKLIVITPSRQSDKIDIQSVKVGDAAIYPSSAAHNLSATFDKRMSLQPHMSQH